MDAGVEVKATNFSMPFSTPFLSWVKGSTNKRADSVRDARGRALDEWHRTIVSRNSVKYRVRPTPADLDSSKPTLERESEVDEPPAAALTEIDEEQSSDSDIADCVIITARPCAVVTSAEATRSAGSTILSRTHSGTSRRRSLQKPPMPLDLTSAAELDSSDGEQYEALPSSPFYAVVEAATRRSLSPDHLLSTVPLDHIIQKHIPALLIGAKPQLLYIDPASSDTRIERESGSQRRKPSPFDSGLPASHGVPTGGCAVAASPVEEHSTGDVAQVEVTATQSPHELPTCEMAMPSPGGQSMDSRVSTGRRTVLYELPESPVEATFAADDLSYHSPRDPVERSEVWAQYEAVSSPLPRLRRTASQADLATDASGRLDPASARIANDEAAVKSLHQRPSYSSIDSTPEARYDVFKVDSHAAETSIGAPIVSSELLSAAPASSAVHDRPVSIYREPHGLETVHEDQMEHEQQSGACEGGQNDVVDDLPPAERSNEESDTGSASDIPMSAVSASSLPDPPIFVADAGTIRIRLSSRAAARNNGAHAVSQLSHELATSPPNSSAGTLTHKRLSQETLRAGAKSPALSNESVSPTSSSGSKIHSAERQKLNLVIPSSEPVESKWSSFPVDTPVFVTGQTKGRRKSSVSGGSVIKMTYPGDSARPSSNRSTTQTSNMLAMSHAKLVLGGASKVKASDAEAPLSFAEPSAAVVSAVDKSSSLSDDQTSIERTPSPVLKRLPTISPRTLRRRSTSGASTQSIAAPSIIADDALAIAEETEASATPARATPVRSTPGRITPELHKASPSNIPVPVKPSRAPTGIATSEAPDTSRLILSGASDKSFRTTPSVTTPSRTPYARTRANTLESMAEDADPEEDGTGAAHAITTEQPLVTSSLGHTQDRDWHHSIPGRQFEVRRFDHRKPFAVDRPTEHQVVTEEARSEHYGDPVLQELTPASSTFQLVPARARIVSSSADALFTEQAAAKLTRRHSSINAEAEWDLLQKLLETPNEVDDLASSLKITDHAKDAESLDCRSSRAGSSRRRFNVLSRSFTTRLSSSGRQSISHSRKPSSMQSYIDRLNAGVVADTERALQTNRMRKQALEVLSAAGTQPTSPAQHQDEPSDAAVSAQAMALDDKSIPAGASTPSKRFKPGPAILNWMQDFGPPTPSGSPLDKTKAQRRRSGFFGRPRKLYVAPDSAVVDEPAATQVAEVVTEPLKDESSVPQLKIETSASPSKPARRNSIFHRLTNREERPPSVKSGHSNMAFRTPSSAIVPDLAAKVSFADLPLSNEAHVTVPMPEPGQRPAAGPTNTIEIVAEPAAAAVKPGPSHTFAPLKAQGRKKICSVDGRRSLLQRVKVRFSRKSNPTVPLAPYSNDSTPTSSQMSPTFRSFEPPAGRLGRF